MTKIIGNTIYWIACVSSILVIATTTDGEYQPIIATGLVYLIGRDIRYILTGKFGIME